MKAIEAIRQAFAKDESKVALAKGVSYLIQRGFFVDETDEDWMLTNYFKAKDACYNVECRYVKEDGKWYVVVLKGNLRIFEGNGKDVSRIINAYVKKHLPK